MTSLSLPPSTRQSVSQGPWVIMTLRGFFVDQSLILIKKCLGIAFVLQVRGMEHLKPRMAEG